ncbi:PqiB family protein [Vibrio aphrogenes]|uniref:PqiB family protein n=1 Tax=Vibrio aphrogenes TaxID=1891186 RepID=UPI000B363E7A|nr:MlaD family protein [Vibrio aphrogenes]
MKNEQSKPHVKLKQDRKISPLWILPIIALCLAAWLGYKSYSEMGQRIQIHFSNAQGLIEGRTTIRYQGLEVGIVRKISLADNLKDIFVDADIYPKATKLLSENTRFWLVKPKASLSGITGLDALVSGNYIAIQPDDDVMTGKKHTVKTKFTALKEEPMDIRSQNGLSLILHSKDLGSITVGSKVMFRKIPIGEVTNFNLADDSNSVTIQVSIKQQFAHIINSDSRFWNVSGINANVGFNGIDVQLESMNALLMGAIAVDSPQDGQSVSDNHAYKLYPDLKTAGRGIRITMTIPDESNITPHSPIMYKGIEVGRITDVNLSKDKNQVMASAAIDPAFSDDLNTGSHFVLEEAKLSLTEMKNVSNFIRGNFVSLVPGTGEKTRQFTVIKKNELLNAANQTTPITLTAENTYGLEEGTQILYRGIPVGNVNKVHLDGERVRFDAQIDTQYANLVKSKTRFYINSSVDANFTGTGVNVSMPPIKQLLAGSITFDSQGESKINKEYHLYASKPLADLAKYENAGSSSLTLFANNLPPVSIGSPVLYRNLEVGKVSHFSLVDGGVKIQLRIENRYKYLITKQTVFWNHSGIQVDANLSGLKVTASPITSLIKGAISFDSLPGVDNKLKENWLLYPDYKSARQFGKKITLIATDNQTINIGSAIKYQGVQVGEVTLVHPNFNKKNVEITARIFPEFVANVTPKGSHYWVVSPEIGLSGAKHIDAILSPYIEVKPSNATELESVFNLTTRSPSSSGVVFYLQSPTRASVKAGAPLLYRDFEVGQVKDVELGDLADRVITTIEIQPQYAYLIRKNSVFWNVSGVNVSVGISGAKIKSGTMDDILRGGIAFATPDDESLQSKASAKSTFLLHKEPQPDWLNWQLAIPK